MGEQDSKQRCVMLSSSDEDENNQECMPRIIDAVSLKGCSTFKFEDQPDPDVEGLFHPECELKEDDTSTNVQKSKNVCERENNKTNIVKEASRQKKRLKLIHLSSGLKTSRHDGGIVDASKLALQENIFKTKELFDTFLRVCQDQDNSPEMEKVVEKLERAYGQTRQEYIGSDKLQKMLKSETEKVNTSTAKPWLNLKTILDELKFNKKSTAPKLKLGESEESQDARAGSDDDEPFIECPKKRRHLKKLERTLRALNLKIKKLEEKEVDLDDDDSSYVKLDRYREQFTKIYKKVCEIKGKLPDADRPYLRKVSFAGTTYPQLNRCIEKYYNKHREFPDFQDIKKLVVIANEQEKIEMQPVKIHQIAQNAFKEFGEMLKRLRQYDDYDIIVSYLEHQVDPARDDPELQEQLSRNAIQFRKKEQEVLDKFAAQDAGIHSDMDSDARPKKKRKILIKKRDKPSTSKSRLSSSESSDESSEEEEVEEETSRKGRAPGPLLDSDEENYSSEEKKKKIVDKGKTLIGKKRIIKRGKTSKLATPKKIPQNVISSDEEGKDPKDTFTNYLGLNSQQKKTLDTSDKSNVENGEMPSIKNSSSSISVKNQIKSDSDSDNSVKSNKTASPMAKKLSSDSDSSTDKFVFKKTTDEPVFKQTKNDLKITNGTGRQLKITTVESSDSEPSDSRKRFSPRISQKNTTKTYKESKLKVIKLDLKPSVTKPKPPDDSEKICLSSDSEVESAERTSANESDLSAKRSGSGASKAPSLDNAGNSDSGHTSRGNPESDRDSPIIVLSEEMDEVPKFPQNTKQPDKGESDSDTDVFVLSPTLPETRTVAPRRTKVEAVSNARNKVRPPIVNPVPQRRPAVPQRRPAVLASSTPNRLPLKLIQKRKGPDLLVNGVSKIPKNGGQLFPQVINGAARKTIISKVPQCKSASNSNSIPLIELD